MFSRYKIKTIKKCATFFLGIIAGVICFSSSFSNDRNSYTRIMMHELENEEEIEYLF